MRTAFINSLLDCAAADPRIWLLCGDLGYGVLEPFSQRFPDRFINVGVAEQNMIGVAAGLALTGRKVLCYSIGNFNTLRCFEQIRNDVCYHNCDVKIVSVGGGLAYGGHGYTHHAVEDLAAMRALPNMTVLAPGDPVEVAFLTLWMLGHAGPCYLRLGKAGEPVLHPATIAPRAGAILPLRSGYDLLLLSTGGMLATALDVAAALAAVGVEAAVASCPFLKPLDAAFISTAAGTVPWLVTIEEHSPYGGLADAVGGVLAGLAAPRARLLPFNVPELALKGVAGSQAELLKRVGLDAPSVATAILRHIKPDCPHERIRS